MHQANLSSKSLRHALAREPLQGNQPIGARERMQRGHWVALDVVVDVGAAQSHDQRPIRIKLAKSPDAARAAPCMQRNHQLGLLSGVLVGDVNLMAELAQDARPAHRRGAISRS